MSIHKSHQEAKKQAKANANLFQKDYVIFLDTSLQWRVEPALNSIVGKDIEIVHPVSPKRKSNK